MKRLLLLSLLLTLSTPAKAGPIQWVKRHPTATAFIAGGAAATVHAFGLHHCRQGSVENCQAKYGSAWQSFAFATGANFAVIGATHGCWKDKQPAAFCSIFSYGGSAAQAGFGLSQWTKKGEQNEKSKVDLSSTAFVRR